MILTDKAKKLLAEILVEQGYGDVVLGNNVGLKIDENWHIPLAGVDILPDTLEARRQADVAENWLLDKHWRLYMKNSVADPLNFNSKSESVQRKVRMVWCLNKLADEPANE